MGVTPATALVHETLAALSGAHLLVLETTDALVLEVLDNLAATGALITMVAR